MWACAAVVAVALSLAVPAIAAGPGDASGGNRPHPQSLWKAYPLDPSGRTRTSGAKAGTTSGKTPPATQRRDPATGSGGGSFPTVWVAIAGPLVAVLAAALVLARRVTVPADWRARLPQSRPRLGRQPGPLVHSIGRLRTSSSPPRPARRRAPAAIARDLNDALMDNVRRLEQHRKIVAERFQRPLKDVDSGSPITDETTFNGKLAATGVEKAPANTSAVIRDPVRRHPRSASTVSQTRC